MFLSSLLMCGCNGSSAVVGWRRLARIPPASCRESFCAAFFDLRRTHIELCFPTNQSFHGGRHLFVSFGVFGHFGHVQPTFVRVRHLHGDGTFDAFPPERRETSWGRLDDRPHHVSPGSLHVLPHLMERVGSTHVLQRNPTQDQKRRRVRTSQEGGGVWQSMPASKLLGRTSRRSTRHSR